jgi:hypothetical protein
MENKIEIYSSSAGIEINIVVKNDSVWATQKQMAEIFETTPQNVTIHLKKVYKDGEIDEIVGLALGVVAGAPGLISIMGKAVNGIAGIFQKDKQQGTKVGNALKHWGHELEEAYVGAIADILKVAFPKSFGNQDVKDQTSQLYDVAHNIYAAILLAAAVSSGFGAAEASNTILSGLEGGLSAFKTAEVVVLAQKVAAV